jgi:hypothetical protein
LAFSNLKNAGDNELIQNLSHMDFLMLYAVDLTTQPNIDYQQYPGRMEAQPVFPLSGRAVLLRDGRRRKIVSGAVIKTNAPIRQSRKIAL